MKHGVDREAQTVPKLEGVVSFLAKRNQMPL